MKRYGGTEFNAVDGIDLRIGRAELYALLGPNGSGKSTTVGVIATLAAPTSGRVTVLGHDVVREPMVVRRTSAWRCRRPGSTSSRPAGSC